MRNIRNETKKNKLSMGFLGDLGKGFIRSAVNQVGRDTGKLVSNNIYGDAHATPIRNVSRVGNSFYNDSTKEEVSEENLKSMLNEEGYKPRYITHGIFYHFFIFLGLFMITFILSELPIICIIITILIASYKFRDIPHTIYTKKESVPIYSSDRRYKRGYRIDGFTKETVKYKMPATSSQKKINIVVSIVYLAICSFVSYYGVATGSDFHRYSILVDHEQFLKDSATTMESIEFWKDKDSAIYNSRLNEFNKKYNEAIEYIKTNNSIKK